MIRRRYLLLGLGAVLAILAGLAGVDSCRKHQGTEAELDRVLGQALVDGARDAANRWVFDELLVEGFEPWGGARLVAFAASPLPTHGVDVTGHLDAGVASLEAHQAYLQNLGGATFDARDFLSANAAADGARLGVKHAIAFEVFTL